MGYGQGWRRRGQGGYRRGFGRGGGGGFGQPWGPGFAPSQQLPQLPPLEPGALRILLPTNDNSGLDSTLAPRFARAPYLTIVEVRNGEVANTNGFANPFAMAPSGAGIALGQWLISNYVSIVVGATPGPNLSMVLQQAGIQVFNAPPGIRVLDALRQFGLVK